jgi:hypothetical protein
VSRSDALSRGAFVLAVRRRSVERLERSHAPVDRTLRRRKERWGKSSTKVGDGNASLQPSDWPCVESDVGVSASTLGSDAACVRPASATYPCSTAGFTACPECLGPSRAPPVVGNNPAEALPDVAERVARHRICDDDRRHAGCRDRGDEKGRSLTSRHAQGPHASDRRCGASVARTGTIGRLGVDRSVALTSAHAEGKGADRATTEVRGPNPLFADRWSVRARGATVAGGTVGLQWASS